MVRVGFQNHVGICRFSENFCGESSVVAASDVDVQESDTAVFLGLAREFDSGVYSIQNFIESFGRVPVLSGAS